MASVSVVSSSDFRANLGPAQNSVPEGDDPFSLLLNSVADAKAGVQRPDAPRIAERRNDAPAKPPKSEADADRQAKRQAKDTSRPEAKPKAETQTSAPAKSKPATDGKEVADEPVSAEALLALALTDTQQPAEAAATVPDATLAAEPATAPVVAAETQAPETIQAAPTLTTAAADAASAAQTAQAGQNAAAAAKVSSEIAAAPAQAEAEAVLPKISAETSSALAKPLQAASALDARAQVQPGTVQVANAVPTQTPAPLEMLNAAISKHVQFALHADAGETAPDAPKPVISSNAVAPNFALTTQVNSPVTAQTQTAAEVSRAVPLDQLAVEIATRANKGERRFDIRLDPPELGRIDVRLEIDSKGNTTTKLIVERAETLDLLQRDARGLEKALQNAGLKTDAGGLEFSLQQDTQAQQGHGSRGAEADGRLDPLQSETEILTEIPVGNASLAAQLRGGVDIRI